jgi:hypothetical protein
MALRAGLLLLIGSGIAGFSLLLLIISVGMPVWLDDGQGNTIGLFRQCYSDNTGSAAAAAATAAAGGSGCYSANRVTQGGLSVFGILLLSFGVMALIAGFFLRNKFSVILFIALGLLYFASMFIMAAYATWGQYSRDEFSWYFPLYNSSTPIPHTSMGSSYNLCVAAHYFLWTALVIIAYDLGQLRGEDQGTPQ